jgi:diguanylate cyclase (GGDEF)-like protein
VADPHVLIVSGLTSVATDLKDRLVSLGVSCQILEPGGAPPEGSFRIPTLVLVIPAEEGVETIRALLSGPEQSTIENLPILTFGSEPAGMEIDEMLVEEISDEQLVRRLGIWSRWGQRGRRLVELEIRAQAGRNPDSLTGLPGYQDLMERIEAEAIRHERYGAPLGLILADVAGMRALNEQYGHPTGDRLLKEVGATMRGAVRALDSVARYSADEFAILLPQSGAEATARAAERLRNLIATRIFRGEPKGGGPPPLLKISMNFGCASLPDSRFRTGPALLAAAEAALEAERSTRTPPAIRS